MSPGDKPTRRFANMDNIDGKFANKDESTAKTQKGDNAGSEIQIECKWSYRRNS